MAQVKVGIAPVVDGHGAHHMAAAIVIVDATIDDKGEVHVYMSPEGADGVAAALTKAAAQVRAGKAG